MKRFTRWWKKRRRGWWTDYQLPILMVLGLVSLLLGFVGFTLNGITTGEERTILDNLYLTLGLLSMNSGAVSGTVNWQLQVARFFVPAIAAYTALLALARVFTQQAQQVKLWFIRDHIIICGLGRKGIRLANLFQERGDPVVIIEADEGNDWIETVRASGIVVLDGDASDPEMLLKARLLRARYVISVLGDDGLNAEVAVQAEQLSNQRESGVLTCIIHIVDPQLWYLLREKELYTSPEAHFRLELFNIFDHGASLLLKKYSPWNNESDRDRPSNRLLLIGLGNLGQSLLVQASMQWQEHRQNEERLKFLLVDLNAEEKTSGLYVRYPNLEEISELEPLQLNVHSADFHRAEYLFNGQNCNFDAIYVCIDDDSLCLHVGLLLYQKVRDFDVPVIIRMVEDAGLALLLQENDKANGVYRNLHAFPILDQTCTPELVLRGTHEVLARELHEVYIEGLRDNQTGGEGHHAFQAWEDLPEDTREWNRKQADRISLILEKYGYRIAPLIDWKASNLVFDESKENDEVKGMARMEHNMWCQEMRSAGWQFAPTRSKKHKTNPVLVPWEELTEDEVYKNKNFIRRLPRVLARAGFQIQKKNSHLI